MIDTPRGVAVVLAVSLIIFLSWVVHDSWNEYKQLKSEKVETVAEHQRASDIIKAAEQARDGRNRAETARADRRAQVNEQIQAVRATNEAVRSWYDQPIPVELRNIDTAQADRPAADRSRNLGNDPATRNLRAGQDAGASRD